MVASSSRQRTYSKDAVYLSSHSSSSSWSCHEDGDVTRETVTTMPNARTYSGETSSASVGNSSESSNSINAARRRRSHRPRGCRGGRKNRKKQNSSAALPGQSYLQKAVNQQSCFQQQPHQQTQPSQHHQPKQSKQTTSSKIKPEMPHGTVAQFDPVMERISSTGAPDDFSNTNGSVVQNHPGPMHQQRNYFDPACLSTCAPRKTHAHAMEHQSSFDHNLSKRKKQHREGAVHLQSQVASSLCVSQPFLSPQYNVSAKSEATASIPDLNAPISSSSQFCIYGDNLHVQKPLSRRPAAGPFKSSHNFPKGAEQLQSMSNESYGLSKSNENYVLPLHSTKLATTSMSSLSVNKAVGEILPPAPRLKDEPIFFEGPNPYALTNSTNDKHHDFQRVHPKANDNILSENQFTMNAKTTSAILTAFTGRKSVSLAHIHPNALPQDDFSKFEGPEPEHKRMGATYASVQGIPIGTAISRGNDNSACRTENNMSAPTASPSNTQTIAVVESLFSISPRSFLTGAKGNPPTWFVW